MIKKLIKVGNSYAIMIPKIFVQDAGISYDAVVNVTAEENKKRIVLDFMKEKDVVEEVVDKEVYTVGKRLLKRYLPAFKELVKR